MDWMEETKYQVAKFIESKYSDKKPVYTLFLWKQCGACPGFVQRLTEVFEKNKNVKLQTVYLDENPEVISKDVRFFPTLRRVWKGKTEVFKASGPKPFNEQLIEFLSVK